MREFFLGACEVAWSLQARLAGLHGFYDRVPQRGGVEKININQYQDILIIQLKKKLDPVGSTVRYEMMKLCTGSV